VHYVVSIMLQALNSLSANRQVCVFAIEMH